MDDVVDLVSDYFICEVLVVFLQQSNLAQQPVMEWRAHITFESGTWHESLRPSKALPQFLDLKLHFCEIVVFKVIIGYGNADVFQAESEQLLD